MRIFKTIKDLSGFLKNLKKSGKQIGFIPTMGALHEGHLSLLKTSIDHNDFTVVSIFVNPTQFNSRKDFERYPITIEEDILKLELHHADLLFLPEVDEIYPEGLNNPSNIPLGNIENELEGFFRPGHFQGVATVVSKLLKVINPDFLYMGQKDFQQCMVIDKLIQMMNLPVKLQIVSTFREDSGLAMSSRNMLLSEEGKKKAAAIYSALNYFKDNITKIPVNQLKEEAIKIILDAGFSKVEYFEVCNAQDLSKIDKFKPENKAVVLTAAWIESIRLIDNLLIN